MSDNSLQQPYDFIIDAVELIAYNGVSYDITQMRQDINIYEDIYSPTISGNIQVVDTMDLPHLMPLVGEEHIRIRFTKPTIGDNNSSETLPIYEKTFRIYNITDRHVENARRQIYVLHFTSDEFIKNQTQVVQKGWKKTTNSTMVQEIFDEMVFIDKPLVIEPTRYEQNFVAGNLNPFQFFNLMASRSVSDEENGSMYLFYEDKDQYNFVTIGKLFQQESEADFIYQPANLKDDSTFNFFSSLSDIRNDLINVEAYFHAGNFNILQNAQRGMYASKLIHVDGIRQKFEIQEFKLDEVFDSFRHVSNEKPWTQTLEFLQTTDANIKLIHSDKDRDVQDHLSIDPDIFSSKPEEFLLPRSSQINQANTTKLVISAPGDPRRTAGKVITFHLPQNASDVSDERPQELDNYLQGRYLIASLRHQIKPTRYSLSMELIKDTLHTPIEHIDVADKYSNIY